MSCRKIYFRMTCEFLSVSYISTPGNDTWLHGPVNTYLVDFNVTFPNYPDNTKSIGFHAMLKCRPQGFDVLNCFLDNSRMAFKDSDMYKEDESYRINELFLIKFDRRGVRHLMVSPRLTPWQLGVLRTIANQLNFGVDLLDKSNSTFNDIERSYIGECDSFVNISREVRDIERPPGKENFEIISMAGFRKRHNEVVEIEKRRNLENCIHRNEYMFLDPRHPANPQIVSEIRIRRKIAR